MTVAEIKQQRHAISERIRGLETTKSRQKKALADILKEAEEKALDLKQTDLNISAAYKEYEKLGQQWRELET